ncbi:MAG: fibro-slime domain-containing protein [Fibrobacter sp.]|nr:fibro-slime domain-containing protein [Fibrobacter sp.]
MSKRFSISGLGNVFGKFLPALLVAVGAFSSMADAQCAGTVRFKPPTGWTQAYFGTRNCDATEAGHATTLDADGYFTFDLSTIGHQENGGNNFSILNSVTKGSMSVITKTGWVGSVNGGEEPKNALTNNAVFGCPGVDSTIYIAQDPLSATAKTYIGSVPPSAKYFYVLTPDDKEWQSDNMMVSANGGAGVQMTTAPNMCGWMMMVYEESKVPDEVLVYLKNKPEEKLGATGLWGNEAEPTPLPLKSILEALGTDRLYFMPDDSQWPEGMEDAQGLFVTDPGVSGVCSFDLAAIIYDSDVEKNDLFSEYQGSSTQQAENCVGVHHGIVEDSLGKDNKPHLNTKGTNGPKCFTDDKTFSTLFNYTANKNEVVCYNMPFSRAADGRWAFDSDHVKNGTVIGGFSPREDETESTAGNDVITSISPTKCPGCRKKRKAEGPVTYTVEYPGITNLDYLCNGPGWSGGVDCEGMFVSDDAGYVKWNWDIGAGGGARWGAGEQPAQTRNQHFCFESHATFTYSEDQEFTFRGDDDIWVFINKRLAVDNGGAHLAAPGHVVLKNLNNKYGAKFLEAGKDYSLDIFFCDRRTTMSNVIIKTNMFIKQTSGLNANGKKNSDGTTKYSVCYDKSGDGSCASVALGQAGTDGGTIHACDDAIKQYGTLKYKITTRAGQEVATLESGKSGWQYGGIDISNPFKPIVNADKISGLAPGSYRLVIDFYEKGSSTPDEKARTYINFRIKGNLDVMTQNSTYTVNTGDEKSPYYTSGTKWTFVDKGLAGSRVPVYVSAFADGGVDLLSAVGQKYTLVLDKGMTAYTSKTGDTKVTWPKAVGATGIDTIWIYQGLDGLNASPEEKSVSLKTAAKIKFYAPRLDFAEPVSVDSAGKVTAWKHPLSGDPDSLDGDEYFHWIGSDVDMYVLIVNPATNEICKDCQMTLTLVDASAGVTMPGDPIFLGEGTYVISIRSRKEYYPDSTAYITISTAEDAKGLSLSSYVNMHFRKPPVPYPQLVDMFDVRGESLGNLSIPSPYYSATKEYLDGKGDSIAIHYDRPFAPNPQGAYKDSLPFLICLDWDETVFEKIDFTKMKVYKKTAAPSDTLPFSKTKKDTAVACSYMIDSLTIYNTFMARYKANGNKSDSVLTFAADSAFSSLVKTAGRGKVLNFATYEDRKKVTKGHFDGSVTDRIAPVIVSARVDNFSDQLNRLTVTLSEPVKLLDQTNSKAPFTFYMNSATEVAEAKRYASSTANAAPGGLGSEKLTLVFDKTQSTKNPTPRLGDFIRFRADSWMWSDTANIASDVTKRLATDSTMHWNSPTDYNSTKRLPSPWVTIVGDYSVEVSAIKLATMNKDIDAKNTPAVEVFTIPTTMGKDEIAKLYPNTLGFIVKSDMASFMSKDSVTEKFFNEHPEAIADVYFQYDVKFYTNLGNYVAGKSQKIYCLDEVNKQKLGKEFFGGKDCRSVQGNFYISWNMLSDKKRLVGTGAYIAKLSSYVKLAQLGKAKSSKAEETDMWGAKRGKGVVK